MISMGVLPYAMLLGTVATASGYTVHGVVSALNGEPIEGVRVVARRSWMTMGSSHTNENGEFNIISLNETLELRVICEWSTSISCAGFGEYFTTPMLAEVRNSTGATQRVDFTLPVSMYVVTGVKDADGMPVIGADVQVISNNPPTGYTQRTPVVAEHNGTSWWMWLLPGTVSLRVSAAGVLHNWEVAVGNETTRTEVTVNRHPLYTVGGEVLTHEGFPVQGVTVWLSLPSNVRPLFRNRTYVYTDSEGRYMLYGVPAARKVSLRLSGSTEIRSDYGLVDGPYLSGVRRSLDVLDDVQVDWAINQTVILLKVTGENQQPLARVRMSSSAFSRVITTTDGGNATLAVNRLSRPTNTTVILQTRNPDDIEAYGTQEASVLLFEGGVYHLSLEQVQRGSIEGFVKTARHQLPVAELRMRLRFPRLLPQRSSYFASDRSGRFNVSGLQVVEGEAYVKTIRSGGVVVGDGFTAEVGMVRWDDMALTPPAEVEVNLPLVLVAGQVLKADGTPAARLALEVIPTSNGNKRISASAKTDDAGVFHVALQEDAEWRVTTHPSEDLQNEGYVSERFTLRTERDDLQKNFTLTYIPVSTVTGTVAVLGGWLAERFSVSLRGEGGSYWATTDRNGSYVLQRVRNGNYSLNIESPYDSRVWKGDARAQVLPGGHSRQVFTGNLVVEKPESGNVTSPYLHHELQLVVLKLQGVDDLGLGVPHTSVRVYFASERYPDVYGQTDATGWFNVAVPVNSTLTVEFPNRGRKHTDVTVGFGQDEELRLLATTPGRYTLRGVVTTAHGYPVAALRVQLWTTTVTSDGEGRFAFFDVQEGEHDVFAKTECCGRTSLVMGPGFVAAVVPGSLVSSSTFNFTAESRNTTFRLVADLVIVRGRVVDEEYVPVEGAHVRVSDSRWNRQTYTTDENGFFWSAVAKWTEWEVAINGTTTEPLVVQDSDMTRLFVLATPAPTSKTLRGVLVTQHSYPLVGAKLRYNNEWAVTDEEGMFNLTVSSASTSTSYVHISGGTIMGNGFALPSHRSWYKTLNVTAEEEVEIVLEQSILRGRVVDEGSVPVANVGVVMTGNGGTANGSEAGEFYAASFMGQDQVVIIVPEEGSGVATHWFNVSFRSDEFQQDFTLYPVNYTDDTGSVQTLAGHPVETTVWLVADVPPFVRQHVQGVETRYIRTDSEGAYEASGLRSDVSYHAEVSRYTNVVVKTPAGNVSGSAYQWSSANHDALGIVMNLTVVRGVVLDTAGNPLDGYSASIEGAYGIASTGPSGSFAAAVPPQQQKLFSFFPDERLWRGARQDFYVDVVGPEDIDGLVFELKPVLNVTISGTVRTQHGYPISSTQVVVENWWMSNQTNGNGSYQVSLALVQGANLSVRTSFGSGFARVNGSRVPVPVLEAKVETLVVTSAFHSLDIVEELVLFEGQVVGPQQQPLPGAVVRVTNTPYYAPYVTDADGLFYLFHPGNTTLGFRVQDSSGNYTAEKKVELEDGADRQSEVFVLQQRETYSLQGNLTSPDGYPVAGARLRVECLSWPRYFSTQVTNDEGKFVIPDMPDGAPSCRVGVERRSASPTLLTPEGPAAVLFPNSLFNLAFFNSSADEPSLPLVFPISSVAVKVVGPDGVSPLFNVSVEHQFRWFGSPNLACRTDARGECSFALGGNWVSVLTFNGDGLLWDLERPSMTLNSTGKEEVVEVVLGTAVRTPSPGSIDPPLNVTTPAPYTPTPPNVITPVPPTSGGGCISVPVQSGGHVEVKQTHLSNNLSLCWAVSCPAKGKVLFEYLDLEEGYDWLTVDGKQYTGSVSPASRFFHSNLSLRLTTDGNTPSLGFSAFVLCY